MTQMPSHRAVIARIYGRVQGVGFRAWTVSEAERLGLTGWVRNRRDGSVEALFAGPDEVVEQMLERCRRGPPLAVVERIEQRETSDPVPPGFKQLPTV